MCNEDIQSEGKSGADAVKQPHDFGSEMTGFEGADGQCPYQFSCRYQRQIEQYLQSLPGKGCDERVFFSVTDNGFAVEQDFLMFAQGASQKGGVQGFVLGIVQMPVVPVEGE